LKDNNLVYSSLNVVISWEHMQLYKDDSVLPDLENSIIHHAIKSAHEVFDEETTGFEEHLGDVPMCDAGEDSSLLVIEGMGVLDGEHDNDTRKGFTASVLWKLVADVSSESPDVLIPRG
ncbi:hypothetical protein FRB99_003619, partial [Tulasnella sp. 403]